jgi:hypothetical protein
MTICDIIIFGFFLLLLSKSGKILSRPTINHYEFPSKKMNHPDSKEGYLIKGCKSEEIAKKGLAGMFFSSEPLFRLSTPFSLWEKGRG